MFVSSQKKMGLAMGILLGAMGTSATLSATSAPAIRLADDQAALQTVVNQPMLIQGLAGTNATVAIIDTGAPEQTSLSETPERFLRLLAAFDADAAKSDTPHVSFSELAGKPVASGGASGEPSLVVARAYGANGASSVEDAIRVIEWVVSNKDQYRIGALDLSFIPPTTSTRGDDPLNQAVMAAWEAKIVVVSSADTVGI